MDIDSRSRKWQITINNPIEKGFTHENIKNLLIDLKSIVYWCMSDEVGEKGTFHSHIYIGCSNAVRFSSLKNKFKGAHFEICKGTSEENRNYVFKLGKWESSKKKETNLIDSQEEFGELPVERQGKRNDLTDLYDMIKAGLSNYEIIESNPEYMMCIDKIEHARQIVREEKYKNVFRELDVTYIYGTTGSGKTRGVMEQFGYENVFRVTDYLHPFDNYKGQDVVIFEEFRSSLKIQEMLNFLDGYPVELPCRYANKIACFTKVYMLSNISLSEQYVSIQNEYKETWNAFKRRIHHIRKHTNKGILMCDMKDFIDGISLVTDDSLTPFDK